MRCLLGLHPWLWKALPGRSLHGTDTCRRCGVTRSRCMGYLPGTCGDPEHYIVKLHPHPRGAPHTADCEEVS